jgi:hypothetical protein
MNFLSSVIKWDAENLDNLCMNSDNLWRLVISVYVAIGTLPNEI